MQKLTVRIPEELHDEVERVQSADDDSQSEAVRRLLRRGTEYDSLREERDRLERQCRQLIEQREEHAELVEYVEQERSVREQRARRQSAPVWRRAKWWVLGAPSDDAESQLHAGRPPRYVVKTRPAAVRPAGECQRQDQHY